MKKLLVVFLGIFSLSSYAIDDGSIRCELYVKNEFKSFDEARARFITYDRPLLAESEEASFRGSIYRHLTKGRVMRFYLIQKGTVLLEDVWSIDKKSSFKMAVNGINLICTKKS